MAGGAVMAMPASSQENRKGSLLFIALAGLLVDKSPFLDPLPSFLLPDPILRLRLSWVCVQPNSCLVLKKRLAAPVTPLTFTSVF